LHIEYNDDIASTNRATVGVLNKEKIDPNSVPPTIHGSYHFQNDSLATFAKKNQTGALSEQTNKDLFSINQPLSTGRTYNAQVDVSAFA